MRIELKSAVPTINESNLPRVASVLTREPTDTRSHSWNLAWKSVGCTRATRSNLPSSTPLICYAWRDTKTAALLWGIPAILRDATRARPFGHNPEGISNAIGILIPRKHRSTYLLPVFALYSPSRKMPLAVILRRQFNIPDKYYHGYMFSSLQGQNSSTTKIKWTVKDDYRLMETSEEIKLQIFAK